VILGVYPFKQASAALAALTQGAHLGRFVIGVSGIDD